MGKASSEPGNTDFVEESLDPLDWTETRQQAHRMLDDVLDYISTIRKQPVWRPIPTGIRSEFARPLPREGVPLEEAYLHFQKQVLPYASGNSHPGFMGWVQGGGTVVGMLAEMLAGGLNANLGGRDHAPIEVEKQVVRWMAELFQFPTTATGLFVTGSSIANFLGVLIARNAFCGLEARSDGLDKRTLTAYSSTAAHRCIPHALDMAGIGSGQLRRIPVDRDHRIDLDRLQEAIARDRSQGLDPFCIVGTAGSVDVGSIDDLRSLREIATKEKMWLHIDGAYAALGLMAPSIAKKLDGIQLADSIAFDFHKWAQVPYDAGFLLVRDGKLHLDSFHTPADYLRRDPRAMAAGSPWPCDFGPDLSRGFRALKTWMTLQHYGTERLGRLMVQTCQLAEYLRDKIAASEELELLAPVSLNIVCFRYRCSNADQVNQDIVPMLQEGGETAPSSTMVEGRFAIRAAIFNHRTSRHDLDRLVQGVIALGRKLSK